VGHKTKEFQGEQLPSTSRTYVATALWQLIKNFLRICLVIFWSANYSNTICFEKNNRANAQKVFDQLLCLFNSFLINFKLTTTFSSTSSASDHLDVASVFIYNVDTRSSGCLYSTTTWIGARTPIAPARSLCKNNLCLCFLKQLTLAGRKLVWLDQNAWRRDCSKVAKYNDFWAWSKNLYTCSQDNTVLQILL